MGNGNYVQTSFLGGEWSPLAHGQMEDPRYRTALARCLNALPLEEGPWTRRPGFHLSKPTRNGTAAALLPFEVKEAASYDLELTDGHARLHRGKTVLKDSSVGVVSISSTTPAVVELSAAVDWETDDQIEFVFDDEPSKRASPLLTGRVFSVIKVDTTHFAIYDPITQIALVGPSGWTSSSSLSIARVLDLETPYSGGVFPSVRSVQSQEDCILLHKQVRPQVLTMNSEADESDIAEFEINPSFFRDGPYLDAVEGSLATPSGTSGLVTLSLSFQTYSATKAYKEGDYVTDAGTGYRSLQDANVGHTPASSPTYWTTASPGEVVGPNGFVQTDIGRLIRLFSNGASWSWGRISALSTAGTIDPNAATVAGKIGDMTQNGGLAALFDGDYAKLNSLCASRSRSTNDDINAYGGLDLGTSPSAVTAVVVYPALGTEKNAHAWGGKGTDDARTDIYLYGSNTAPTAWNDGTLLGTHARPAPAEPVTITSSDTVSTWRYIWVAIVWSGGFKDSMSLQASQFQFFNSAASPGSAVQVEILGDTLVNTAPCVWRLGAYSDTTGWPTCGCYTDGRLWLGGAIDNRFDASKSNDIYNFEPTNAAGAVADNNAISYTVNADDVNPIFWMEPNAQGIVMGTQGGEWLISASANNNVLTPTTIQARRVTKYKCANISPVTIGLSTVFVQKAKRNVLEFISDVFSGRFFGPNLNERARHMTKTGLEQICGQEGLTPIIWGRRDDGKLVGCTYRRVSMSSSEPPKFLGWHRHEIGSNFEVVSIARSASDDGVQESLAMITRDPETDRHYVERLSPVFEEEMELEQAMFLDCAIVPSCGEIVESAGRYYVRLHGLWNHNGKTLTAFLAGIDCGEYVVTNGYVDVPLGQGDPELLTRTRLQAVSVSGIDFGTLACAINSGEYTVPAAVGYSYASDGQQLRPYRMEDTGARAGVAFAKTKRIHEHGMLVHNTQGISVGTDFTKLRPALLRTPGQTDYPLTQLFSGIPLTKLDADYSLDSMVCWRVTRPYPATVLASGAFLQTQDK